MRALAILVLCGGAASAEPPRLALGAGAGVALQSDQYVAGVHGGARGLGVAFVDAELVLQGGRGPDYWTVRAGLHVRPRLEVRGFHGALIFGPGLYHHRPHGAFARFCERAELTCRGTGLGLEGGLALGWRWFSVEYLIASGDLPLHTFVSKVTFWP